MGEQPLEQAGIVSPQEMGERLAAALDDADRLGMRHESPDDDALGDRVRPEQGKGIAVACLDKGRNLGIGGAPVGTRDVVSPSWSS
jgi:hypothetical protein